MVSYLKKNMVYCFDNNMRNTLKTNIDRFEILFFSTEQREIRKQLSKTNKDKEDAVRIREFEKRADFKKKDTDGNFVPKATS